MPLQREIKIKRKSKDIKLKNRPANLRSHVKKAEVRTKRAKEVFDDSAVASKRAEQPTAENYATAQAEDKITAAVHGYTKQTKHMMDSSKAKKKRKALEKGEREISGRAPKERARSAFRNKQKSVEHIKKADRAGKNIRHTADKAKRTIKTTEKTAKATVKTAKTAAKATAKTAKVSARAAKAAARVAKVTGKAIVTSIKVAFKAVATAVKATIAATKALISALMAGGWVVVTIILILVLIGAIVSSVMGIFFSNEVEDGITGRDAVRLVNAEYYSKIQSVKDGNPEVQSITITVNGESKGINSQWKYILSVYSVVLGQETSVIDFTEEKVERLKAVFWDMVTISTETIPIQVQQPYEDQYGNIQYETVWRSELLVRVIVKSTDEMAAIYGFTRDQNKQLAELLQPQYDDLWNHLLSGAGGYGGSIVEIALAQVGNSGETYWEWYGFSSRMEWCAVFVSWCANEAGVIDTSIPRFTFCEQEGAPWFQNRGQWEDAGYIPQAGDIIFFDWEQDGRPDHVGIVESISGDRVYTVEGNAADLVKHLSYALDSVDIFGYGVPEY